MNAGPSAGLFINRDLERDCIAALTLPGLEYVAVELVAAGITEDLFRDSQCRTIAPYALRLFAETSKCDQYAVKAAMRADGIPVLDHEWDHFEAVSDALEVDNAQGAVIFMRDLAGRREARRLTHEALAAIEGGADHLTVWAAMQQAFEQGTALDSSGWALESIASVWDMRDEDIWPKPIYGRRDDGLAILAPGCVLGLVGPPAGGKSMMAIALAIEVMKAGHTVAYYDFESVKRRVGGRVRMHRDGELGREQFRYKAVESAMNARDISEIRRMYREDRPTLVVLDGVNRLLGLQGVKNANDATEVSRLIGGTIDRFRADDVCVVTVDHTAKNSTGDPMGSRAKLALMDYCLHVDKESPATQLRKGGSGFSFVDVSKDRDGDLSSHAMDGYRWGRFAVESDTRGRWSHTFQLPGGGYS